MPLFFFYKFVRSQYEKGRGERIIRDIDLVHQAGKILLVNKIFNQLGEVDRRCEVQEVNKVSAIVTIIEAIVNEAHVVLGGVILGEQGNVAEVAKKAPRVSGFEGTLCPTQTAKASKRRQWNIIENGLVVVNLADLSNRGGNHKMNGAERPIENDENKAKHRRTIKKKKKRKRKGRRVNVLFFLFFKNLTKG